MHVLNDKSGLTKPIFNFIKLKSIPGLLMIHVTFIADLLYPFCSFMYVLLIFFFIGTKFYYSYLSLSYCERSYCAPPHPHLTTPLLPR